MKVFYSKGKHVIIHFPAKEMKQALGVLKALAQYFKADFLFKAAQELEHDLQERITYDPRYHPCENCFTEIDVRTGNCMYVDSTWLHKECPTLKGGRPT